MLLLATWEYTCVGVNGDGTVNGTCDAPLAPYPSLNNIPVRSGPEGGTSTPTVGNQFDVRFINGDPTRPRVVGNQALVKAAVIDASQTVAIGPSAQEVVLAGGNAPTARLGDAAQVYFPTGAMPVGGMVVLAPGTFTGTITFPGPGIAVITTGQAKVLA